MKLASKLVFLFRDSEGFGTAIYNALQPNPSSTIQRSDEKFELSLEKYGIKDQKACGDIANFVDSKGLMQVSLLLVQNYEPPILACVVNEIFISLSGESMSTRILTLPYILSAAKLKCEDKNSSDKTSSLYGTHLGPATNFTQDIITTAKKPSPSLQIHYEPLVCLLEFVRVFKIPTALLIGKKGVKEEDKVLHEIGEILGSAFNLCFDKSKVNLNIIEGTTKVQEPWRALYG